MKKKIVLIDDNEGDQLLIKQALGELGLSYDIHTALSGEEGVNLVWLHKPVLVITDTNLPGINGFEVCRQIKELFRMGTQVVVMTGVIDAVDAVRAREMGADEYCVKTSDFRELVSTLQALIK